MTSQEKKELIKKKLSFEGEKRSYNEIAADLELTLWTEQHKGGGYFRKFMNQVHVKNSK